VYIEVFGGLYIFDDHFIANLLLGFERKSFEYQSILDEVKQLGRPKAPPTQNA